MLKEVLFKVLDQMVATMRPGLLVGIGVHLIATSVDPSRWFWGSFMVMVGLVIAGEVLIDQYIDKTRKLP